MAETIHDVFGNAAGLIQRHGFYASVVPDFMPTGSPRPVTAIVTDCPPVILGFCIGQVAEDPEPFLPNRAAPGRKAPVARPRSQGPGDLRA